jgi:hypothetical protein
MKMNVMSADVRIGGGARLGGMTTSEMSDNGKNGGWSGVG